MEKTILHCDLNNFYASVEERKDPSLKGKPIAVCGNPELRHGIILAKNQIAKSFGVKTAETIWQAKQKCPGLILLPASYNDYHQASKEVKQIYLSYTDYVESFGLDECWLDVTSSVSLFGDGKKIADEIRERTRKELGLTVSVGVAPTKTLAKLGSDMKKPDATTVITYDNMKELVYNLKVTELMMIGGKTAEKLAALGIKTIGDLARFDREVLREKFGIIADRLIDAANGTETDEVKHYLDKRKPKSVSHGTTTPRDITSFNEAESVIYALSELVAARLRRYSLVAGGVHLIIRLPDFTDKSKQTVLSVYSANAEIIAKSAVNLLNSLHTFPKPVRAITVGAFKLFDGDGIQQSFFDEDIEKKEKLDKSLDKLREKYGFDAIKRGKTMLNRELLRGLEPDDDFLPFKR